MDFLEGEIDDLLNVLHWEWCVLQPTSRFKVYRGLAHPDFVVGCVLQYRDPQGRQRTTFIPRASN